MRRVKDPEAAAGRVTTEVAAARLYEQLVLDEDENPGDFAITTAIDDLERRFPGAVTGVEEYGGADAYAASRGAVQRAQKAAQTRKGPGSGQQKAKGETTPTGEGGRSKGESKPRQSARRSAGGRKGGRRRASPRVRRAVEQTGIPAAARSTSELVLQAFGFVIGASFLYLVLTKPRAVEAIAGGIGKGVNLLVKPVDPIAPGTLQRTFGVATRPASRREAASAANALKDPTLATGAPGAPPLMSLEELRRSLPPGRRAPAGPRRPVSGGAR